MKRYSLHCSRKRSTLVLAAILAVGLVLDGCSPAPRRKLNAEDKTADFYWLFSQFGENYAPLDYKQSRYGFNYDALKQKYLTDAQATKNNDEFYALMYQFVSEFKDAHTSASLINSSLPKRALVSYLGFAGKRKGAKLLITDFLPTVAGDSDFPVKKNDLITKLNGVALDEIVKTEMAKWRHLGSDEANLTYHMNKIFNRVSTSNGIPAGETAVLTIERSGKEVQVALPWVKKDLALFKREQDMAKKQGSTGDDSEEEEDSEDSGFKIGFMGLANRLEPISFSPFEGLKEDYVSSFIRLIPGAPGFSFWKTFRFVDGTPSWLSSVGANKRDVRAASDSVRETLAMLAANDPRMEWAAKIAESLKDRKASEGAEETMKTLAKDRNVPSRAIPIADAKTFPAYVTREKVIDGAGKETGATKLVAYMRLDTFSPAAPEKQVLEEIDGMLQTMQTLGVNDIVIDMIDNGGGSLLLGMALAQKFSNEKVVQPEMQFRLSETWLDSFEQDSISPAVLAQAANPKKVEEKAKEKKEEAEKATDSKREILRRVYESMLKDKDAGLRLSQKFSTELLAPQSSKFNPNDKLEGKLNIVLLVNEMCASMCDIFTATMKDNNLVTVVGTQTMGAGGNVVNHPEAPNSHLSVRQTESLVLRRDGTTYIENNGVMPDVAVAVNESANEKYASVRDKAIKLLMTTK